MYKKVISINKSKQDFVNTIKDDQGSKKTLFCGFNEDGSGGGYGYYTVSSYLMMIAKEQQKLLREQKLWTQRAEIQDPKEAFELEKKIEQNDVLINYLFLECMIPDVIEEFIDFEDEELQEDDTTCIICGYSCMPYTHNHHFECLQDLETS